MTLMLAVFLIISFVSSFHSEFKYSSALLFTITLACATLLVVTGFID